MRRILKAASILGVATVIKMLSGAARAKFLAWQLGPAGVGLVGQALMYSIFTIQLCSLNVQMGMTKYISEETTEKRFDRIPLIINTAWTLQLITAAIFIVATLPFSKILSRFLFSDERYWGYFVGITLVTPFALYLIGMADPIFYGLRRISEYTRLMILYTLLGLLLILGLVSFYKVDGMLAQIPIISIAGFAMSYYFIKKKTGSVPKLNVRLFRDPASHGVTSNLFQYGLISFIPGTINMLALFCLRGLMMRQYGMDANGFYQVAYAISSYYLPFVMNGIWGHFYPEMCALKDKNRINSELNQFVRFSLFASTAIAAGCILFGKYAILILFSKEFMKAYDLLAMQATGDIFFILFCMFSTSLMARKQFKGVMWISTIGYNMLLISSYMLLSNFSMLGFRSLNAALALTNIIIVGAFLIYSRWDTGFVLSAKNVPLLSKSLLFIAAIYLIPDTGIISMGVKLIISSIWLLVSVTREEMRTFLKLILPALKTKDSNAQQGTA